MVKVLSFELHKLFRTKSFYIWTIISALLSVAFLLIYYAVYKATLSSAFLSEVQAESGTAVTTFPTQNGIMSMVQLFGSSPMTFCMLIFICSFVCNDFENSTLKNIVSKGYKREAIFTAKFIAVMILAFIMTAVNMVSVFLMSTVLFGDAGSFYPLLIPQLIILILGILTFAGLYYMLCVLFKKSAPAAIISLLALIIIPQGLAFANTGLNLKNFDFTVLWFGSQISNISGVEVTASSLVGAAACIAIYFVATYVVSVFSVKKMEV